MSIKSKIATAYALNLMAWLAMLTVLVGLVFVAAGIAMLLAPLIGPAIAALIVGGGLIVLIGLVMAIAWLANRPQHKPGHAPVPQRTPDTMVENQLRPVLGDRATDWVKSNSTITLVGALSAGVIIAASPGLRRLVYEAGKPIIARKALRSMQDFLG